MKKIFYLILIGIMIIIPKSVFAANFSVSYSEASLFYRASGNNTFLGYLPVSNGEWRYQPSVSTVIDGNFPLSNAIGLTMNTLTGVNTNSTYNIYGNFSISKKKEIYSTPGHGIVYMKDLMDELIFAYKINNNVTEVKCQLSNPKSSENTNVSYEFRCDNVRLNSQQQDFYIYYSPTYLDKFSLSTTLSIVEIGNNAVIEKGLDDLNEKQQQTNDKLDEANETSKGIWGTIKDVLNNIISLPMKLVELLIDALKNLFVPTDEQLYEIINDSKDLAENFGFVGETINFFITIFTSLLGMVNANGCIELPEFTIGATSLFDSFTFWQTQNVCLNDNVILSSNINTIRTITSIVLVGLFINFAARQFFNILNKNDSESGSLSYDPRTGEVK